MKWELSLATAGNFTDNRNTSEWYFPYIETALTHGAIKNDTALFRPGEPITREEMAVMLVRALGYDALANRLNDLGSPFPDVTENIGYITIAKDFGIISGMGDHTFMPAATATREQAATMMIKMAACINRKIEYKNGFYALSSSGQMHSIGEFDSISFGWSSLSENDGAVSLNTTAENNNEYRIPSDYETPYQLAEGKTRMLMVTAVPETAERIVSNETLRLQAVTAMAEAAAGLTDTNGNTVLFDGITVDLETLKGEAAREGFNALLTELRTELDKYGKKMAVAVHPKRRESQAYYDGYDYKTIGQLADKVILMAHDYNAKTLTPEEMAQGVVMTPLAPIDEVYYALRAITDETSGVQDKSKIVLQLNFAIAQWKLIDGKVTAAAPYTPDYDALFRRIETGGVVFKYDQGSESPYITFHDSNDGTDNVLWYEDERSVEAKIKLSKFFGVTGISVWRLGNIPDKQGDVNLNVAGMLSE
jgi:spore germination protein YaaH